MTAVTKSIKLSAAESKRLASAARKTKRSAHFIMKEAVQRHLNNLEKRLDFIREAEVAMRDYHETGLHVSSEAMEKWVFSTDKSVLPPWEK